MSSEYTHYNASYEKSFVEGQTAPLKNPKKEINPLPNAIYSHPVQYYDSHVKNSSQYPNIDLFKAVDYEYIPPDIGGMLDKSIEDNKMFVFGPHLLPHREYNYKS